MNKKQIRIMLAGLVMSILITWLLWPLTSGQYAIQWDPAAITYKKQFLEINPVSHKGQRCPNILLIMADDLGKTDISLYGPGKVSTPHIDQLGREGVIFDQAYVTSPVCSPSRAAILTGRYPQRYGFIYQMQQFYPQNRMVFYGFKYLANTHPWQPRELNGVPGADDVGKQGLPPSEILLPELLRKAGYRTALIGKWHLGDHQMQLPGQMGFDRQYGFYASHSLYIPENTDGFVDQHIPGDFTDKHTWSGQREGPHAIYRNGIEVEETEYLTDAITRECIDFIKSRKDTAFFLMASYNAPHTPFQAPETLVREFEDETDPVKRVYYAMIRSLDNNIGRLINTLESLGIRENTLVFFVSDNGGAAYTGATDNAPLRGGKITDFEGGLNVPMILSWPQNIKGGIHYSHPVSAMDIFGTITGQLGIRLPGDRVYDGVDLVPFLQGIKGSDRPHDLLYWNRGESRAIRSSTHKLLYQTHFRDTLLFNMRDDYLEQENIFAKDRKTAMELIRLYEDWHEKLADPLWPPLVHYVYEDKHGIYYFDN